MNHERRASIGNLVAQEFTLERGVDGYADGAELIDGEPAQHGIDVVVEHRHDRLAGLHAQRRERMGQTGRRRSTSP